MWVITKSSKQTKVVDRPLFDFSATFFSLFTVPNSQRTPRGFILSHILLDSLALSDLGLSIHLHFTISISFFLQNAILAFTLVLCHLLLRRHRLQITPLLPRPRGHASQSPLLRLAAWGIWFRSLCFSQPPPLPPPSPPSLRCSLGRALHQWQPSQIVRLRFAHYRRRRWWPRRSASCRREGSISENMNTFRLVIARFVVR